MPKGGPIVDWIERLFNVSPDGGNGILEATYYGVAILGVTALAFRHRAGRWIRAHRGREARKSTHEHGNDSRG
jgi:hypothetical protein